jgi:[protein-PII] uridylyltransferase
MLTELISGEELLSSQSVKISNEKTLKNGVSLQNHIDSINDIGYLSHFSIEEINEHLEKIESGLEVEVFIKEIGGFTNLTLLTKDSPSLLSRLCGAIAINDLNIHDAKIFTRNDGIVIDTFNVTEFRTNNLVDKNRYEKLINDLELAAKNELAIGKEFKRVKSKWKRLENKLLNLSAKIKIEFHTHEKYTIIDVFAPDKLGLLYKITQTLKNLELSIYFAKISTKEDGIVDSFYVLDRKNHKVSSEEYELIRTELTSSIEEML